VTRSQLNELRIAIHYLISLLLVLYVLIVASSSVDYLIWCIFLRVSFGQLFILYLHSWGLDLCFSAFAPCVNAWD
jgi:hypothetical protein